MSHVSNHQSRALLTPPLALPQDPTVFVFSGWGNAGKTNTIGRALSGLQGDTQKIGIIINERSDASVEVDLKRLPKEFEKVGLQGCSCCSQLPEVLTSIENFKEKGRVHAFIEQGHLSVTSDLRSGLLNAGHKPVVVFLFNPAQYSKEYQCIQFGGIRSSDIVLLTHCRNSSELVARGQKIISAATSDLKSKPVILVDSDPRGELSPTLWEKMLERSLTPNKKGLGGILGSFFGGDAALESHSEEIAALRSQYSEESLSPYVSEPSELVRRITQLRESGGLRIERVKGFLASGLDVNIEWVPSSNTYHMDVEPAPENVPPVLAIRTLQGLLRPHFPKLVSSFATPDVDPDFIQTVAKSYPTFESCVSAVRTGRPPLSFEPDRILLDLVNCRFSMNDLIDDQPERFNEMCEAIIQLLDASITARLNLLLALDNVDDVGATELEGMLNASYFILRCLSNDNLTPFRQYLENVNSHPLTSLLDEDLGYLFISAAAGLPKVRFEGRKDLTRSEVSELTGLLARMVTDGRVPKDSVSTLVEYWLSPNYQDKVLKAEKDLLQGLLSGLRQ